MKRHIPTNNRPRIATSIGVLAAICFATSSCSPQLVPVGTGGLLTRSYDNYSQSTVMRSEAIMASQKPAEGRKTEPPKKEYTYSRSDIAPAATTKAHSRAEAAQTPAPASPPREPRKANEPERVAPRAAGIPKVTEEAVSGFRNVTFVTQEQAAVVTPSASSSTSVTTPAAVDRPSAAAQPVQTARERKALDRERKQKAKQLLAQREAEAKAKMQPSRQPASNPVSTPNAPVATAENTAIATEEVKSISIEEALARVTAIPDTKAPDHKPTPVFTTTPANERTLVDDGSGPGAVAPVEHNFKPNETEHVKFSYYDPFGSSNNRFVVVLDEQRFCYPYPGKFLSGYGARGRSMHTGVDIKGIKNDTIRAAFAGTVRMSKPYSGYGNCVVIRHRNGLETLYSHNSRNLVRVGQTVQAGEAIALIGRTGQATTEHCHFEVRIQGQHINPALLLDYDNRTLRAGVLSVSRQGGGRIVAVNRSSGLAPSEARDVEDAGAASPATPQSVLAAGGGETRLASATSATSAKTSSSSSTSSASASVHTVKSGDTLWAIAKRYRTTVAKICTLNGLEREATLPLGKKINLR